MQMSRRALSSGLLALVASACGLGDITLPSTTTLRAATEVSLELSTLTSLLAALTLDAVGVIPIECPRTTPKVPAAKVYAFDFGEECAPSPALVGTRPIRGRATATPEGERLTLTLDRLGAGDTTFEGSVSGRVSTTQAGRLLSWDGTVKAHNRGAQYEVSVVGLRAETTLRGAHVDVTTTGAITVRAGRGLVTLTASGLGLGEKEVRGSASLSLAGSYLALRADLQFAPVENGIVVTGSVAGFSFELMYAY